jgi:hypothetical protein
VVYRKIIGVSDNEDAEHSNSATSSCEPPQGELPTNRQLDYATDLGIEVPPNITKEEMSDLISFQVRNDRPASEQYQNVAQKYGVRFTRYTGKKELFDRIFNTLTMHGREKDLVGWFVYRVYRELVHGRRDVSIESHEDPAIQKIAGELMGDDSLLKSIRRYKGSEIIWFGQWTSPDGYVRQGGSNKTIAYKRESSAICEALGLKQRSRSKESFSRAEELDDGPPPKPKGKRSREEGRSKDTGALVKVIAGTFLIGLLFILLRACH